MIYLCNKLHSSLLRINTHSMLAIFVTILSSLSALTACSDDDTAFGEKGYGNDSEIISFSVNTSDGWNNATPEVRSYEQSSGTTSKSLTLTSSDAIDNLYLIPTEYDGISPESDRSISTRSTLTDNDNITDFGVFASMRPEGSETTSDTFSPDYMYNVQITKANSWTPEDEYLWPNKASLHFNAYSPYVVSDKSLGTEGITSLPYKDNSAAPTLSWTTPADVADQYDLMWATPVDASSSPCSLTFNHALTAIKFITGSEMAPCTVKEIKISNIVTSADLNLETGVWSLGDNKIDYAISPAISLSAAKGSSFVTPSTPITSDKETMLLLPQTLSSDNIITLTINQAGTEHTFTATLDNQIWTAGKTMVYQLSANPMSDILILDILDTDGKSINTLQAPYTGGNLNFSVKSNNSQTSEQIPWKAEFIDANGNATDRPVWISSFPTESDGDASCKATTEIEIPTFSAISTETSSLRSASDINTTSGNTPYNLSNSTGAPNVENTANTYVVSAPGQYSLPLVYGNAVKNGSDNQSAYIWNTRTRNVLTNFLNHLGNAITDPYIYNNSGCEPEDAYLVWEGRIGVISNLTLSEDKHFINFTVSPDFIRQGNAVVAVRDKDSNIMWSWQIWFTPHTPDDDIQTFSYQNVDYHIMARNIGQTTGGDIADFKAETAKVRFTQISDGSFEPKSVILTINREEHQETTSFHYSYYQWGRKDPFNSGVNNWYHADHSIVTATPLTSYDMRPADKPYVTTTILNPEIFWSAQHGADAPSYEYLNLWNVQTTDRSGIKSYKSIYDPSPVGFKVPGRQMVVFTSTTPYAFEVVNKYVEYTSVEYTLPSGKLDFTLFGYLSSTTGAEVNSQSIGPIWLNTSMNLKNAGELPLSSSLSINISAISRTMGYGVRPIKDE